jgi:hypothetical protein
MFRQFFLFSMVLALGLTSVSCVAPAFDSASSSPPQEPASAPQVVQTNLSDGQYPVQQATYDDATGEYRVFLLNTAPGESSTFNTLNLPMAQLTEEEVSNGQQSYLRVEQGQPSLHLAQDFRIEYIHNVTETVANPETGQSETVIVRQEPSFWTPFAGALAGQALGSLLFTPHYYMPPVYQPGGVLVGYGGYGRTYNQAVQRYQSRHRVAPPEVRNRQTLRTTGRLRSPNYGQSGTNRNRQYGDRSTGSGYGSSTLRRSNRSTPQYNNNRSRGFGSRGSRGFSRRRR